MDQKILDFVSSKRLAIVGVSRTAQKSGTSIYTELKNQGYEVFGVNPLMDSLDGDKCYASISELAEKVDGVVICLPPQKAAGVIREASAAGLTKIWLQLGAQSAETRKAASEAGVTPVEGKCILMYAGQAKGVHGFHKFVARLFGQY
ncbi:MAG TPA: CoA-binding protein [Anaerolineaceae bacterium]